ncbi:hypothetical protein GMAR_ORF75 [Golden Marseillevirus]|uniref:hypothetical protein n=1 Tax=Golden Marseillevirus TaxID=1720526 RepID=UPI000877ACEA|nr:hypothetical protein GMAR_ORF75 [Golden Marseillevirus]ALX27450.1 hypothetical protein GMAR_ORF75 [Golden Marseillevirus]
MKVLKQGRHAPYFTVARTNAKIFPIVSQDSAVYLYFIPVESQEKSPPLSFRLYVCLGRDPVLVYSEEHSHPRVWYE